MVQTLVPSKHNKLFNKNTEIQASKCVHVINVTYNMLHRSIFIMHTDKALILTLE